MSDDDGIIYEIYDEKSDIPRLAMDFRITSGGLVFILDRPDGKVGLVIRNWTRIQAIQRSSGNPVVFSLYDKLVDNMGRRSD